MSIDTNEINHEFLYKISHPKTCETKGFLLGTCHLFTYPYLLSEPIQNVFQQAKCIAIECNGDDHKIYTFFKVITSKELRQSAKLLAITHGGLLPGVEVKLLEKNANQKRIIELETIDKQLETLYKITEPLLMMDQDSLIFRTYIAEAATRRAGIETAYLEGSRTKIIQIGIPSENIYNRDVINAVIFERNHSLAESIHKLLHQDLLPLVAVGVAHLYKKNKAQAGLISLLRLKGWQITPVLKPSDFQKLNSLNPKSMEILLAQDWCSLEKVFIMLEKSPLITAKACIAASKKLPLLPILSDFFNKLQVSYDKQYSLNTLLKGVDPMYTYLLEDLIEKYEDIPYTYISTAIKYKFPEEFVKKLMNKCSKKSVKYIDIQRVFEGDTYSPDFLLHLLEQEKAYEVES